jgi:hypothetical protein
MLKLSWLQEQLAFPTPSLESLSSLVLSQKYLSKNRERYERHTESRTEDDCGEIRAYRDPDSKWMTSNQNVSNTLGTIAVQQLDAGAAHIPYNAMMGPGYERSKFGIAAGLCQNNGGYV